jgi:broad specificity phosphatase PhoE
MNRSFYFITHPNVVSSREVPVTQWPLSALGRERMMRGLGQPWMRELSAVYCSSERKAIEGAAMLAAHLGLPYKELAALGENDRSSTGFLPPDEFERHADAFFAKPTESVRGWEAAVDAQARIVAAVSSIAQNDTSPGAVAIVSHGAVGTLLYCHVSQQAIDRRFDQPANGGGNFFRFTLAPPMTFGSWLPIDLLP